VNVKDIARMLLAFFFTLPAAFPGDFDVVISEIHYHPPELTPGDESNEFVELENLSGGTVDVSGWFLEGGISFIFPDGARLSPDGFVVVALDATKLQSAYGLSGVYGNFTGRLSNNGEKITLRNEAGDLVDRVDYRDEDPWPSNPDGLGPSLEKSKLAFNGENQSAWRASVVLGGTPGRRNSTDIRRTARSLVAAGATWKYKKGTAEPATPVGSWALSGFNDASWSSGASGFGYGDSDDATVLSDMEGSYTTAYIRRKFTFASLSAYETVSLSIVYDDAYIAYLNGTEVGRSASAGGTPGTPLPFNANADSLHENNEGSDSIDLTLSGHLNAGENTLAIQVLNDNLNSSDLTMIPTVTGIEVETPGIVDPPHDVEINEVFAGNGPAQGFIELHNESAQPANISGYKLVSSPVGASGYVFPPGTTLASRARLFVAAAGLPFQITDGAQWFGLVTPDLRFVDGAATRARPAGRSWGRYPDGDGDTFVLDAPTPGSPNALTLDRRVVINEIEYHPPLAVSSAEFIELFNQSGEAVDVSGWSLDKGVHYTLPASQTLPAGGYLVLSGDLAAVQARYGIAGVLGPWTGKLSNAADKIELKDALGNRVDVVHYADDGTWPLSTLLAGPDGFGPSIELVNPAGENNHGSAWLQSTGNGTPGAKNSRFADDPAPVIRSVSHSPAMPRSTDVVTVTARALDEQAVSSVNLFSRPDGNGTFSQTPMLDDGAHGDGAAGDSRYGATLPARASGSIVQFYVEATDSTGQVRRFPSNAPIRVCLYQVDDRVHPPGLPLYRAILRAVDLNDLVARDVQSDVLLDGTFIHKEEVTYNVGIRYRGEHSRSFPVKSFRIQLNHDQPFEGITDLDLNAEGSAFAYLAADFFRRADLPAFQTNPVAYTLNNSWGARHGGVYLRVEAVDSNYVERQFVADDTGNLYRGFDAGGGNQGDLSYKGSDPSKYVPIYEKKTNQDLNNYSDIIALTNAFTNSSNADFASVMRGLIDVEEWVRYFAVETAMNNQDGCIATNVGEDYFVYHRPSDEKWIILPWDQNENFQRPDQGIFRMQVDAVTRLVTNPSFEPLYYQALINLLDGPFAPSVMDRQIDSARFALPGGDLDTISQFVPVRQTTIRGLVPQITPSPFIRGDANSDRQVDISDAVKVLLHLFGGIGTPTCLDALDVDDNARVELTDAVYLLGFLFQARPAPPAPFPNPGNDPTTGDPLGCTSG
jgi:hypothetical protein